MPGSVIVSGARTPIGKLAGTLAGFSAMELGGAAIAAALERAGLRPDQVDYVFMGQVLGAGQGQITARQAAVAGGIPMTVPATTVNKVCLSGLNAIYLADLLIAAGEAEIVVAGGMESMTRAPYLLPGARSGYRLGDATVVDSMMHDGLFCAFDQCAMGLGTDRYVREIGISRDRQDAFSALSHERAAQAIKDGRFSPEITPVSVPQRKGDPLVMDTDEGVRPDTTVEALARLRPAFDPAGTVTAGNASQISDGAAAVIVASKSAVDRLGLGCLAEIAPVTVPQRKGDPLVMDTDEGVRPGTTVDTLARLRPAFDPAGTITAGNASQISDGAAAVIVASKSAADRLGLGYLAEIAGYGQVAGPDASLLTQPSRAALRALERAGLGVADVSLFEINEAFAAVAIASMDDLGITSDICNVNGGAIALGHPIGMSGTRLALSIALELGRRDGGYGVAAMCGGGGQGDALLLRVSRR